MWRVDATDLGEGSLPNKPSRIDPGDAGVRLRWWAPTGGGGLTVGLLLQVAAASAQVSVLTQHNDNGRTGQNLEEVELAPDTVSSGHFGRLFQFAVDGDV